MVSFNETSNKMFSVIFQIRKVFHRYFMSQLIFFEITNSTKIILDKLHIFKVFLQYEKLDVSLDGNSAKMFFDKFHIYKVFLQSIDPSSKQNSLKMLSDKYYIQKVIHEYQ